MTDPQSPAPLSRQELARYARHLVLPEVGREGQERLKSASVLIVGAGGLGSPAAMYLAAAGVGTLGLVDFDEVDATNLQRQLLHGTSDVGRPKLESARDRLAEVNPHVELRLHATRLTSSNALGILEPYDVVLDGTDNFPTRYLVNDACVLAGKTNVYGSIFRWEGQVSVFGATRPPGGDDSEEGGRGPCYRCLFREPPPPGLVPNCAEGGVLGVLPGVIGSLQALEAIKVILDRGDALIGRILIFDSLEMRFREVRVPRNPECPVCGDEPTQTELIDYEVFCGVAPADENGAGGGAATAEGRAIQDSGRSSEGGDAPLSPGSGAVPEMEVLELKRRLDEDRPIFLLDVRQPYEWDIANLGDFGAELIPMAEVVDRQDELPGDRDVVVYCRSGARSEQVTRALREAGVERVYNLKGGILAWADEVDPSMQKY